MDNIYDTYSGRALKFVSQTKPRSKAAQQKVRELIVPAYSQTAERMIVTHNYYGEAVVVSDRHSNSTSGSRSSLPAPSVSSI